MNEKEPEQNENSDVPQITADHMDTTAPKEDGVLEQDADDPCKHWDSIGPCGWGC